MATRYEARKPITHKGTYYKVGDEITGFTGWWRYWQYLRYARVIQLDDPGAPTIDTITRGNVKATVNFTQGDDGGSPFLGYEYKLDAGEWTPFDPQITDSPGVITGLTNGQTYAVRIRALTVESPAGGTQSNSVNVTPATTAAIPTALVATPTDTTASIAFTIANNGGDAVTDVQYKIGTGAWVSTDPVTTASPILVPDLTAGTEYSIRLRSVNTVGSSNQSDAVVFTTDDVPDAPTALVATVGNETVSIAFTPGADNGSTITAYQYTLNDGVDWYGTTPATTASPMVLTMPNDVEYTVKIRAVNIVGNSPASDPVVFTPVDQVPGIPTDLVATPGVLSASIAFTAPNDGGSAITDYEYTMNDGVAWSSGAITASPLVLDPIPAVETTVKIRAKNAVGTGVASAAVVFTPSAA